MQTIETSEVLHNAHSGDQLIITQTCKQTKGKYLEVEAIYQPAKEFAPQHFHPAQEEQFTVLSGKLMTKINGIQREYQAGESFIIPARIPHAMYNASSQEVHFRWKIYPALRTEEFFRRTYQTFNNVKSKNGKPSIVDMLLLLQDFHKEFIITKIPVFLQAFLFKFILPLLRKRH